MIKYSKYTIDLPTKFKDKILEDFDWVDNKELKSIIINFCNKPFEKGFWFYGIVGVGKTLLLSIICRILRGLKKEVLFIEFQKLLSSLRKEIINPEIFEQILDYYSNIDYLLIDDVFNEYSTESDNKIFSRLINQRYNNQKTIIVSSNISKKALLELLDTDINRWRLVSRLLEMCKFIKIKGEDRRITK